MKRIEQVGHLAAEIRHQVGADVYRNSADDLPLGHLGESLQQYENGWLLTYRIARDSKSRYSIVRDGTWA